METAVCELMEISAVLVCYEDMLLRVLEKDKNNIHAIKIGELINELTKVKDDIEKFLDDYGDAFPVSNKFGLEYSKKMIKKITRTSLIDTRFDSALQPIKIDDITDCIDEIIKYYIEDMVIINLT